MLSGDLLNDGKSATPPETLCVSHQLTLPPEERDARIRRLPQVYAADPSMLAALEEFKQHSFSSKLTAYAGQADWVFDHVAAQFSENREEAVACVYRIQPRENSATNSFTILIELTRPKRFEGSVAGWQVRPGN